jgi:hypothetical protein
MICFSKGLGPPGCLEGIYHNYSVTGVTGLASLSGATVDLTKTFMNSNMIAFVRYKLNSVMIPSGN